MEDLVIFCADIGSIKQKKFGWAVSFPDGYEEAGTDIEEFARKIAEQIEASRKVAVGFECPLFVPVRSNPIEVNSARNGEGNRSWSAGAGTGALATGLVEVIWVMNAVAKILGHNPCTTFHWADFLNTDSVYLWEAFVTSASKGSGHMHDAQIAVTTFRNSLPNPECNNAINEEEVFSLVGAAALRCGWSKDINALAASCLVIKA